MFQQTEKGVIISLYILPNAPKSQVIGEHNGALKIKIQAPPVDGKANEEIVRFLSKKLEISKSKIEILKGDKSKLKKVLIEGLSLEQIKSMLS
jgi:uncharacterized protein (TIGR00251 family)